MPRLFALSLILLAGCSTVPGAPPAGPVPARQCRAVDPAPFVGRPATSELGSAMLAASHSSQLRWVPFGGMVTMDFSPSRLTVRLDPQGRVASLACG